MAIGICPTVDFAFKLLFGSPEHARITIHFLNAILGPAFRITAITFRNPFLGKATEDDKLSILDILARDDRGRFINIEIQTTVPAGMHQRLAYYVSSLYSEQLTQGLNYTSLHPAISICVLTKPMYAGDPRLHLDFRLRDSAGLLLTDDLQVHLLQLSKLTVTAQNVSQASPIEKWAYFLLNAETMTLDDVRRLFPGPPRRNHRPHSSRLVGKPLWKTPPPRLARLPAPRSPRPQNKTRSRNCRVRRPRFSLRLNPVPFPVL